MPKPPKKRSGPRGARGRPREFDRDAALNAALEVFWRKGYMQTTLGDLCAAMGIRAPSFYCAFGTREDIFLETVAHYKKTYWDKALERFLREADLRAALKNFVEDAVRIYMRPQLPRGCFVDVSTVGLSAAQSRIREALAALDRETEALFRKRLAQAVASGELAPDTDVPAVTGAFIAFFKGVAHLARGDLSQAELAAIARRGLSLLPATPER